MDAGQSLSFVLANFLRHEPGLGLEDILALLAVPNKYPQASIEQVDKPGNQAVAGVVGGAGVDLAGA